MSTSLLYDSGLPSRATGDKIQILYNDTVRRDYEEYKVKIRRKENFETI